jgi:adenine-specific DNA-methyltransferase
MPRKKKTTSTKTTPVEALKHADKRANIPTEELRDFVADEEKQPKIALYPRDPSLDPQLVWKGKDEQDNRDLAVPAVPIYIQEKIHPQAIVENVRAAAKKDAPQQASLFADFNGLSFEDLIDFYKHEQNWTNRMILGDSLLVMASLAEKEGLKGKVQMIYIDPPYGIKFGSNWQVSTRKRDVKDGKAEDTTRQPEQIKAFRDTWELGIHSYLAYLRDRLTVARELLTESGSVFVQIGDENVHLVRSLLDEVFGSENFVATISFQKTSYATSETIPSITDYLVWYAKRKESVKLRKLFFSWLNTVDDRSNTSTDDSDPGDDDFQSRDLASAGAGASTFEFGFEDKNYHPGVNRHWKTDRVGLERVLKAERLFAARNSLRYKRLLTDFPWTEYTNVWTDTVVGSFHEDKMYVVQTSPKVVARCLLMTTDPGDLVLDPTCGSGTTAYVAEQWGRRWITIDTSRVAIALARTRLMSARFPYYVLADSPEGQRQNAELGMPDEQKAEFGASTLGGQSSAYDIKKGFVYKRIPHITLKSIANNEEIDAIHAKWQEQLEPLRAKINKLAKQKWEEWEIPREVEGSDDLKSSLREWWRLRRERQKEIDASIAKRADTELLVDQPYEDNKRIRVTGPFTVESLSPHRVLAADEERPASEVEGQKESSAGQFETLIIDNLKKAGVQNTRRKERLKFDRLEPYAGTWLHATGEYTETSPSPSQGEGKGVRVKRVAVSIGSEHGTVGPEQVKEAAKDAVQGIGFDLLVVCGFAFDPHVSEEAKRYGKLTVLTARMNPDLAMGDELLKKTGAGNLFMVFGEPDLDVKTRKDGQLVVTIKGVDVYDPTTGEIRSSSTDDIACWFIDTDYNGESFFVRHAYFTGAGDPYDRLKRALRAEIDEAAWSALYSTKSYPFDAPKSGKIAVKVINHYGDEVMKVYEAAKAQGVM